MTRDEILEAARKANLYCIYGALNWYNEETEEGSFAYEEWDEQLELFAKLIAAAEREACASLCSVVAAGRDAEAIEEAILARNEK